MQLHKCDMLKYPHNIFYGIKTGHYKHVLSQAPEDLVVRFGGTESPSDCLLPE